MVNAQQWVAFRVAEQTFGLPIAEVRTPGSRGGGAALVPAGVVEIVRAPEVAPVPLAPEHVAGITNLRGRILPVIHLRKILAAAAAASANPRKARMLVVLVDGRQIGLLVDEASEVLRIAPEEIETAPNLFGDAGDAYISGIAKHHGRLIVLLDAAKLLHQQSELGIRDSAVSVPAPEPPVASPESHG